MNGNRTLDLGLEWTATMATSTIAMTVAAKLVLWTRPRNEAMGARVGHFHRQGYTSMVLRLLTCSQRVAGRASGSSSAGKSPLSSGRASICVYYFHYYLHK